MGLERPEFDGEFIVMIDGERLYFHNTSQIPNRFDHLIRFAPMCPPAPHDEAAHERMHQMNARLQELMEVERNASSNADR